MDIVAIFAVVIYIAIVLVIINAFLHCTGFGPAGVRVRSIFCCLRSLAVGVFIATVIIAVYLVNAESFGFY